MFAVSVISMFVLSVLCNSVCVVSGLVVKSLNKSMSISGHFGHCLIVFLVLML